MKETFLEKSFSQTLFLKILLLMTEIAITQSVMAISAIK